MLTGFAIALLLAGMSRALEGTLVAIDDAKPPRLTVNADRQFQTFALAARVAVDRESRIAGDAAATIERIKPAELTPGEYVRLQIDAQERVSQVRAVARVERARVRSANGSSVVLEDGTTLTIGSVLRFVDERGKPSAIATVRPGEGVLLFRHPRTGNIYRFSAEPRAVKRNRSLPGCRGTGSSN